MIKHSKKIIFLLIITVLIVILKFTTSDSSQKQSKEPINLPISKTAFFMGTVIDINIYEPVSDDVFEDVFEILNSIENKMSLNLNDSEITKINANSGSAEVKVSPETFYVINRGKYYSSLSNGVFDISIGPLVKLWDIGSENARVPSQTEIDNTIKKINYKNILLDESNQSVKLKNYDMMLDLGAIAKGYAADEIIKYLESKNISSAIISLGGNIYAMGVKPNSNPWKIGIQNPFSDRGEHLGIIQVKNKSVVTSGIYERYLEKEGIRYHHILNPFTGYPVENSLASVSIISDKSIDGDGLSTSVFSMDVEEGHKLIETLEGVDAIFVTKNNEIFITSGIESNFRITDDNFKLETLKK
ncbi:FAD:protein FMN transferase [Oceanirhabdus sp. W0125-5]|uniref:FAD:protein FMN transferase n=1 Tax=Oceanirhabdus sp. W0125-5 TaxID=2999116 RepID=UPI0022F2F4CB|nr:FAD:protein FMN transferase [Oceanirhabdus sp. W0125-5]WBW97113.1 FAD:protein FMN transferase [Oceanirhabdus sp. W0125-5]